MSGEQRNEADASGSNPDEDVVYAISQEDGGDTITSAATTTSTVAAAAAAGTGQASTHEAASSSSNGDETDKFEPVSERDHLELTRLATSFSRHEGLARSDTLEGLSWSDPSLDPTSGKFEQYKWARAVLKRLDEEGIRRERAGVAFKNLTVSGSGSALQLQQTVGSVLLAPFRPSTYISLTRPAAKREILHNFDGVLKSGEMLMVLGRPGSGCSTFLKTLCGELQGLDVHLESVIHYNGIPMDVMHREFRGECVYNQEVDRHFPHLTVGQTLQFAAAARTPANRPTGVTRKQFTTHVTQVVMAVLGLAHTYNTKVGNDYIRGVSGGERKRVSIAEMALSRAPIAAWDNSTRGLDSASALEFVRALRISASLAGSCHSVAIYQASQAIYDVFDKVVVLYEGREIYFGPCHQAAQYFTTMGWHNPPRQTTSDFLTSVTNPQERRARQGMEHVVPRTPVEFERYWKTSPEYVALQREIAEYDSEYPIGGHAQRRLEKSKRAQQASHVRPKSPYIISIPMQLKICIKRAYQRIWNDKVSTLTVLVGRTVMSLIIGSVYYGTPNATAGFFSKGAVLFFATLLNALISITEINSLYEQRPIVEKQASYAFVHPFAEALGGVLADIPIKFLALTVFNVILYFLSGLRYEAAQFFVFFLFTFLGMLAMSSIFRTLAAITRKLAQAMALAGVMVLAIVIYTGFVVPTPQMHPWFSWIRWINPIFYCFESLIANEFHGTQWDCSQFVPSYADLSGDAFVCSVKGAVAGQTTVSGDAFIELQYGYSYANEWRNLGILIAFWIFFLVVYLCATELNSATTSTAEFLIFRQGRLPPSYMRSQVLDTSSAVSSGALSTVVAEPQHLVPPDDITNAIPKQHDIFTWQDLCYEIPVHGGRRRLLDHVSGWVKPGTLTALMGVSGAGKTTLLDVLAQRVSSVGVVTGEMLVSGRPLDASFERKTGYVQQQDLHLATTTVREALRFSALLRQPKSVHRRDKYAYVEKIIRMLNMEDFAEAVVGTPGEGLNVEQRKLLTIGVELAAKPALLLFLDEPTSGLDSQSSWAICALLRRLADNGQAVLSTIHQPSAVLFQQFDRLLFLAQGGKMVYFGAIGGQSMTMLEYFERNGARKCDPSENPAEYMLEIIGAGPSGKASKDWPAVWRDSHQAQQVEQELQLLHAGGESNAAASPQVDRYSPDETTASGEFAMPFADQLWWVTRRVFQQYWREPVYVGAKFLLGILSALFIGFSFYRPNNSQQGFQDTLFSTFMLTSIFSTMVQQIMPKFITQRSLYEVRERPSKAYSWAVFLIANIVVELPYQIVLGVVVWASYYFPVYGANQSAQRQGLTLLFVVQFFVFASTFAELVIASLPDAETGGTIATLAFSLILTFNGVMQPPNALPGFWIFMYRVSPLTYLVAGMTSTGLHGRPIECSPSEMNVFNPPAGQTCGEYLAQYLANAPGQLANPSATQACQYCPLSNADQYLAVSDIYYSQRWRNYGIGFAYIGFNIIGVVALYYLFRVKHYNLTSTLVRGICFCGRFVQRLLKRRSGETPQGKESDNGRLF